MSASAEKILKLILEKERNFAKEIARLADLSESDDLSAGLSDYLSGLSDLKSDFLLPALDEIPDAGENAATFLADKNRHLQRV